MNTSLAGHQGGESVEEQEGKCHKQGPAQTLQSYSGEYIWRKSLDKCKSYSHNNLHHSICRLVGNQKHLKWPTLWAVEAHFDISTQQRIMQSLKDNYDVCVEKWGGKVLTLISGKSRKQCSMLPVTTSRKMSACSWTRPWGDYAKMETVALWGDGIWMIFCSKISCNSVL